MTVYVLEQYLPGSEREAAPVLDVFASLASAMDAVTEAGRWVIEASSDGPWWKFDCRCGLWATIVPHEVQS